MEKLNPKLLDQLLSRLETMIKSRKEIIRWMRNFIDDIKKQEIAINATKTATGVVGVISFFGLFTPFAPLAIAGMVGSGVGGAAIAIGDFSANYVKEGKLKDKIERIRKEESELQQLLNQLEEGAELLSKELNISKHDSMLIYLVGIPRIAAKIGIIKAMKDGIELVKVLPYLQAAVSAMKMGAPLSTAFRLSGTVFQGTRLTAMGAGQAARLGTTLSVTVTTKVLGGLGAVIGIADVIYSWSTKNPNRKSAEELLPKLSEGLENLTKMKNDFLKLKE